jgi:hypothetical protein
LRDRDAARIDDALAKSGQQNRTLRAAPGTSLLHYDSYTTIQRPSGSS